jgi:hypothetical protein
VLSDRRSQAFLKSCTHTITAMNPNEAAAIGVEEVNLSMPTSLMDPIDLKAGGAQRSNGVAERRAH